MLKAGTFINVAIFQLKFASLSCFDQLRLSPQFHLFASIVLKNLKREAYKLPGPALTLINEGNLSFIIIYEERRRKFLELIDDP